MKYCYELTFVLTEIIFSVSVCVFVVRLNILTTQKLSTFIAKYLLRLWANSRGMPLCSFHVPVSSNCDVAQARRYFASRNRLSRAVYPLKFNFLPNLCKHR